MISPKLASRLIPRLPLALQHFLLRRIDISAHRYRQLRALLLRRKSEELKALCDALGFEQGICVSAADGISVEWSGIRLSCEGTNRYFKVPKSAEGNEGAEQLETLRQLGIEPRRVIDIGANFGEIALYFAKHGNDCHVLAIEASPENAQIVRHNVSMHEDLGHRLTIADVAVGDRKGTVEITAGLGSENTLMLTSTTGADKTSGLSRSIDMLPLTDVVRDTEFTKPDYIKIDIEGSEPLLKEALCEIRAPAMLIEYSYKNTPESYGALTDALLAHGYRTMTKGRERIDVPAFIAAHSRDALHWTDDFVSIDLWFHLGSPAEHAP